MCAQRRVRSAWTSAQSDQSLRCALNGYLRTQGFYMRTAKTLVRLGGCSGWSESSLGAHAILLVLSRGGSIIVPQFVDSLFWEYLETEKIIRIVHKCEVRIEKSRAFVKMIPKDGFFFPHRTSTVDSFSCIPFFQTLILITAFVLVTEYVAFRRKVLASLWWRKRGSDVNLTTRIVTCYTIYTQTTRDIFLFFIVPMGG